MARIHLSPPDMGGDERRRLLEAFDSNWIAPLGPEVDAFEGEFASRTGVRAAAALNTGTAALHLALLLSGVGPGDEVVVPSLTFAATANAVTYTGGRPVFLDAEPRTWNLDPDLLAAFLAERARSGRLPAAVIVVDIYGQCAEYEVLEPLCAGFGVPLIEDAAEALGASRGDRPAGAFGDAAAFSFNGNKIITTSGGGMLVSDDEAMVARARKLASQAREPAPHYEHEEVGFNYRLSNLLAAVGRGQLADLDRKLAHRRRVNQRYRHAFAELPGLSFAPVDGGGTPNHWLTVVLIDPDGFGADREQVRLALEAQDIESRPTWKPMHLQPVFADAPFVGGAVAEGAFERGLCLPSGSNLSDSDQDRVIEAVLAVHVGT